ncbi:diguanylate cyclase domain-containing protein [Cupriavidus pinatubonensis]|uniref:diguanylate cyclase domain-containing protein n=1 Tax=Cupriavidus pinatubonensis TaxID=248026 RepID=UPI00361A98DC
MACDMDHLKSINDPAVLQHISAVLRAMTRQHVDSVVRYGLDEFLLVVKCSNTGLPLFV